MPLVAFPSTFFKNLSIFKAVSCIVSIGSNAESIHVVTPQKRGAVISAALLRSPVRSDCAFTRYRGHVSSRYTFRNGLARRCLSCSVSRRTTSIAPMYGNVQANTLAHGYGGCKSHRQQTPWSEHGKGRCEWIHGGKCRGWSDPIPR